MGNEITHQQFNDDESSTIEQQSLRKLSVKNLLKQRKNSKTQNLENNFLPKVRVSIIGSSSSGKTTIMKRMKVHTRCVKWEGQWLNALICRNMVASMIALIDHATGYNATINEAREFSVLKNLKSRQYAKDLIEYDILQNLGVTSEILEKLKYLWDHEHVIRASYEKRHEFSFPCEHGIDFITNHSLNVENYVRSFVRTVGVEECEMKFGGRNLVLIDTGGAPVERKRWMNHILSDKLNGILFVVSLSEFNEKVGIIYYS
jgi:hypothetical protein